MRHRFRRSNVSGTFLARGLRRIRQIGGRFSHFGFRQRSQIVGNRRDDSFTGQIAFDPAVLAATKLITATTAASATAATTARTALAIRALFSANFTVLFLRLVVAFIAVAGFANGVILRRNPRRFVPIGVRRALAGFSAAATPTAAALAARTFFAFG